MFVISKNTIRRNFEKEGLPAYNGILRLKFSSKFSRWVYILLFIVFVILMCPWTQNIKSEGAVTSLKPEHRPQTIHTTIPGRIEKWYVAEGDKVRKGDTIVFISEIKEDYFDPNLLVRTNDQLKSKEQSIVSYQSKVNALNSQIDALNQSLNFKIEQTKNKVTQSLLKIQIDSAEFEAAVINFNISQEQFKRYDELLKKGIISQTEYEQRKLKMQEAQAKKISGENKLLSSRNEYINTVIELNSLKAEYNDKIMKAESEKYSALSDMFDTEAAVAKLQNQYANYETRTGYYFITAPQDGFITKALAIGIGETVKEGSPIVSIMPSDYELAVEWYVSPIDLPLLQTGEKVRFIFDGWPSLVFSGWPGLSYGTYGGTIVAIDNNITNSNSKYRVLVAPDKNDHTWPKLLRPGGGAVGFALLKDVPLWYELWRKLNGFPPEFYENSSELTTKK